ncbi:extracellular solute-binding protein [Faunimonas pinastri]|uniref:extracellular solute-binding protein n=1 Tax=Faunimonas pinastri TaxID=1855383 RepID=UPI001EEB033D|nr:extracellular solute-binding protein [Faunimonas pinastri]
MRTLLAARDFNRRSFLKSAASVGVAAAAGPFVMRSAWAASGEVRIFAWAGYVSDEMLKDFTDKTGVKATRTEYGTNDELLNQLRANQGGGFDIIWPTVDRVPNYVEFGLIQPLDEKKVNWDGAIASTVEGSADMGGVVKGARYFVPSDWGTEAIAFSTADAPLTFGQASYGDLWDDKYAGKVTVRAQSALVGIGLWLDSQGKLPHPMRDSFKDEKTMTDNYDVIIKTAIANKAKVGQFWSNENEAQGAFRQNGCVIGQTWDSTAAALAKEGQPVGFVAPKEGALAWMEGMCIPKGAANVDNAYAFINWYLTPQAGAMLANKLGYNTTAKGAEAYLSDFNKKFFQAAYPGDALQKLWWWPIQDTWFVSKRNEYQDKFLSA